MSADVACDGEQHGQVQVPTRGRSSSEWPVPTVGATPRGRSFSEFPAGGYAVSYANGDFPTQSAVQKSSQSDPRRKLIEKLGSKGLLCGDEERRRQLKDMYAYPDITALAHLAKTKETFHEIMGSPQLRPACPQTSIPWSPQVSCHPSPLSTTAEPEQGLSEGSSPSSTLSVIYIEPFDLDGNWACIVEQLPLPSRSVDSERTDLLWNLAGHGTPRVKPLDVREAETDGAAKTGVYLLQSPKGRTPSSPDMGPCGKPFRSIFKPLDEEGFQRRGIGRGMGALREEAAYVIDRITGGQAHVPVTARASVEENGTRKKGSLQEFVEGTCGAVEDFGMPRLLDEAREVVSLDEAQAVACFDIRVFNTDRHTGNLLLKGSRPYRIVSIDHGCVLPAWWALDMARFDAWIDWPHVKAPPTPATLSLVRRAVDTLPQVVQELEKLDLDTEAIWTMRICTSLLEHTVLTHNLTLHSVGLLMTRADPAEPSWLERRVEAACFAAGGQAEFRAEGKYGDLVFHIDKKLRHFQGVPTTPGEAKNFKAFEQSFFVFLSRTFSESGICEEAKAAEDAMRPPWE